MGNDDEVHCRLFSLFVPARLWGVFIQFQVFLAFYSLEFLPPMKLNIWVRLCFYKWQIRLILSLGRCLWLNVFFGKTKQMMTDHSNKYWLSVYLFVLRRNLIINCDYWKIYGIFIDFLSVWWVNRIAINFHIIIVIKARINDDF